MDFSPSSPFQALGCGCFILLMVCAGVGVVLLMSSVKRMEPYEVATKSVKANPEAIATLGEPIEVSWFVSGNFSFKGSQNGEASLKIPVSGPKGKGKVYVEGKKTDGTWTYGVLHLQIDGQKRIALDVEPQLAPAPAH